MQILDGISELYLVGVADRGVPNRERIIMRNLHAYAIALGEFAVGAGFKAGENVALPLQDSFLWLGDELLGPKTWLFIYTGVGKPAMTSTVTGNEPARVLHWNRKTTMFENELIVPVLWRMNGIVVERQPEATTHLLEGGSEDQA